MCKLLFKLLLMFEYIIHGNDKQETTNYEFICQCKHSCGDIPR